MTSVTSPLGDVAAVTPAGARRNLSSVTLGTNAGVVASGKYCRCSRPTLRRHKRLKLPLVDVPLDGVAHDGAQRVGVDRVKLDRTRAELGFEFGGAGIGALGRAERQRSRRFARASPPAART